MLIACIQQAEIAAVTFMIATYVCVIQFVLSAVNNTCADKVL